MTQDNLLEVHNLRVSFRLDKHSTFEAVKGISFNVPRNATVALVGLGAFVGHLFPVFFRFKGGKGVATAAGVVFGVDWMLGLAVMLSFAIVVYFSRMVSLASMVAAVFAPAYYLFGSGVAWSMNKPMIGTLVVMGALLVWRHRENIDRLLKGTESKLGSKK